MISLETTKNADLPKVRVRDSSGKPTGKRNEMEFCEDLQRIARPFIKKRLLSRSIIASFL